MDSARTGKRKEPKATGAKTGAGKTGRMHSNQVSPYTPNPNLYTRYQLLQFGREVGWVYSQGGVDTLCTERWTLYTASASGYGEPLPDGSVPPRAGYVWPSYQNVPQDGSFGATDITTRYLFKSIVPAIVPPPGLILGVDYIQVVAACSPG